MKKKTMYQKYCGGDKLTNADVLQGFNEFTDGYLALYKLGPEFRIAANECSRLALAFQGFGRARGMKEFLDQKES